MSKSLLQMQWRMIQYSRPLLYPDSYNIEFLNHNIQFLQDELLILEYLAKNTRILAGILGARVSVEHLKDKK